jgi:hypothetical protein
VCSFGAPYKFVGLCMPHVVLPRVGFGLAAGWL